jgi:hypothetical protein
MRTAQQKRVVTFRTFLRTLLHELCHHIDYELLKLKDTFHTEGFFKRESSLMRILAPPEPKKKKPKSKAGPKAKARPKNKPRGKPKKKAKQKPGAKPKSKARPKPGPVERPEKGQPVQLSLFDDWKE